MAELNFLNTNDFIRYPLIDEGDFSLAGGGELPRRGLCDAGFLLGLDSEFDISTDSVYLFGFEKDGSLVQFDFRSDAAGLIDWRWLFVFDLTAPNGCTAYSDAEPIVGGVPDPSRGSGFLTIGTLTAYSELTDDVYELTDPRPVEPALLQSLIDSYVREITIANDPRRCPPGCCDASSSSSSNSSDSSSEPLPTGDAFIFASDLTGDIKFKEGYNVSIAVSEIDNSIEIGAVIGAGAGETCEDIIIDEHGFQPGNNCVNCDDYVKSINGVAAKGGKLVLSGLQGVSVVGEPESNELTVTVDVEKLCNTR